MRKFSHICWSANLATDGSDFAYKLRIGGARAELLHPLRLRVATARAPDAQVMSYFVMCHMMDRDGSRDAHPEDEACEKEVDCTWLIT